MKQMNQESRMWLHQMQQANPGWNVNLGSRFQPGNGLLVGDVRIYLVDTSTGWLLSGTTTQQELLRIRGLVESDPGLRQHTLEAAAHAILEAGAERADAGSAIAELAVFAAVGALAQTLTWDLALAQTGSLAGHWFYVAYKPREQGAVGRPAMMRARSPGLLPVEAARQAVRTLVHTDLNTPAGNVGSALREMGGPVLCDEFANT